MPGDTILHYFYHCPSCLLVLSPEQTADYSVDRNRKCTTFHGQDTSTPRLGCRLANLTESLQAVLPRGCGKLISTLVCSIRQI